MIDDPRIFYSLQTVLTTLWDEECKRRGISSSQSYCLVDTTLVSGVRIEPDIIPVVRVSADWMQLLAYQERTGELVRALRKAAGHLHQFTRTLSNNPTRAAKYKESARAFRLTNPSTFKMPERHFKVTHSFTISCPLTGEIETVTSIPTNDLLDEIESAKRRMTARVFMHEQIADILDIEIGAELTPPEEPTSLKILTRPDDTIIVTMEYDEPTEKEKEDENSILER